jgi:type III restriction enzyme
VSDAYFLRPILNSPYGYPRRHWELDDAGQPTQQILEARRKVSLITPIPKPKKRKKGQGKQAEMVFDEGKGLSSAKQQYDITSVINEVRQAVDYWRSLPNPSQRQVTPETARLLQHWRHHDFAGVRSFERHLLDVTCTRARDQLLVTAVNPASEFLDDMSKRN